MTSDQVAKTIMEQIEAGFNMTVDLNGTRKNVSFFKFVGATDLVYSDNSLMFFAYGGKYAHRVKTVITLNSDDLYDIEFWLVGHGMCDKLEEHNGIFFDQLTDILTEGLGV